MKTVKGNLLDLYDNGTFDAIVHGCNCYHNMGGGIAAQIADRYPDVESADNATIRGLTAKLGRVDYIDQSNWMGRWFPWVFPRKIIVNAYTQFHGGRSGDIVAVQSAFTQLDADGILDGMRIGIPAIGCGIAGLLWEDVAPIIERVCPNLDITLVEYDPN